MSLHEKVAIITGGGTGIGFGIAQVLSEKGVKVVLAQRRLDLAQHAVGRLQPAKAIAEALDIRDPQAVERVVASAMSHYGRVDILVNNASITGMPAIAPMLDCTRHRRRYRRRQLERHLLLFPSRGQADGCGRPRGQHRAY